MDSTKILTLVAALLVATSCGEKIPRPSVILISIDTLRADHMGLYGYDRDTTPYLDRLAGECIVFEQAHATAAWTLVSHMSMLTGLYPRQHGVNEEGLALSPRTPLLAERLHRAGYQTIGLYFRGWIDPVHGFDRGFDVFRAHHDAEEAEEHLEEALAGLDPDRPFFLFLHLFDVHCGPLLDRPGPVYDTPAPYDEIFMQDPASRLAGHTEGEIWDMTAPLDPELIAALTALYDGGIRYVDSKLERWIEGWRAQGRLENALLLITADHGEGLGQRGRINGHGTVYEEGLRIPLLIRTPEGPAAASRVDALVSLVDVVPTVLEVVGLPANDLPGTSLFHPRPDRTVLAYQPARETAIRWPTKMASTREGKTVGADLEDDPQELQPFRASHQDLVRLRESVLGDAGDLARWPAAIPIELDRDAAERLRALGYAGEEED